MRRESRGLLYRYLLLATETRHAPAVLQHLKRHLLFLRPDCRAVRRPATRPGNVCVDVSQATGLGAAHLRCRQFADRTRALLLRTWSRAYASAQGMGGGTGPPLPARASRTQGRDPIDGCAR